MTLLEFNQLSVSIAATLFSLALIVMLLSSLSIYRRIVKILDQLDGISQTGLETGRMVKNFIETTTQNLSHLTKNIITIGGIKELVSYINDAFARRKENQRKDTNYGSESQSR